MTFRKQGRKGWYTAPTLPGFGRVGPWLTGPHAKRDADAVERWLRELALTKPQAVRGLVDRRYSLREAWVAHLEDRLAELELLAGDPQLADVVDRFRGVVTDRRTLDGLDMLLRLAPRNARLGWLTDSKNISDICATAVSEGRRPNSVLRSLYRAIVDLLAYEIGKKQVQPILFDVVKPGEDDAREVSVTLTEIQRLLELADAQMRDFVLAALLTGVDRGPLLRLRVRHFDEERGELDVPDTKAAGRRRRLALSGPALAVFRSAIAGRGPDEPIFPLTVNQVTYRWRELRKAVGRTDLRIKDLRHVFATYWTQAGGPLKDLGAALGHTKRETTLRYTTAQASMQRELMDRTARAMGLGRAHLRVEEEGA